jgi:hypothetical protein
MIRNVRKINVNIAAMIAIHGILVCLNNVSPKNAHIFHVLWHSVFYSLKKLNLDHNWDLRVETHVTANETAPSL